MGDYARDISVCPIEGGLFLVSACDSCGGIGEKELDEVNVPAALVGKLTVRVALMELISVGAAPKLMTVSLSTEPNPTGKEILKGIEGELNSIGLNQLPRTISSEKNIKTRQTALGIGVTGICQKDELRVDRSLPGDYVYCLGKPKVGMEITSTEDPEMTTLKHVTELSAVSNIHDILPIGSQGIEKELQQLISRRGFRLTDMTHNLDLQKSAGPASCLIFSSPDKYPRLNNDLPLSCLGRFYSS